eukprot:148687-Chlamydomonas_euryale.AAC.1
MVLAGRVPWLEGIDQVALQTCTASPIAWGLIVCQSRLTAGRFGTHSSEWPRGAAPRGRRTLPRAGSATAAGPQPRPTCMQRI